MSVPPRVRALEALYAADALGSTEIRDELPARPRRMAEGVLAQLDALDTEIATAADGWRLERMPAVDRNILRLGLWELRNTDTPVGVVISQAVELAKEFSTQRSGGFVNAVLAKLAERTATTG